MSRLRSRSSNRVRMRSRSASDSWSDSRFPRPRTIRRSVACPSFSHVAKPLWTSSAASVSICWRRAPISRSITAPRSDKVCPSAMAFRKLAASRMDDGVWPGGGLNRRFSTRPSAKTSTTRARSRDRDTKSMCLIGASCFGVRTRLAPCVIDDSAVPTLSSRAATSWSVLPTVCSILRRSSPVTSSISKIPSTNMRKPSCVGIRPALVCGLSSRPRCSRSCITLRTVAALTCSESVRVRVRDPTGSPVSR